MQKPILNFRGEKELWDRYMLKLKKKKIRVWDRIKPFIINELKWMK